MSHLVFVFGTLKEGFPNFATNGGSRLPGEYETVNLYPFLVGERHSPWMINAPGCGAHVIGQVFRVDANTLARMDILERVSEADGYERVLIKLRPCGGIASEENNVCAYLKHPRRLHAGMWRSCQ